MGCFAVPSCSFSFLCFLLSGTLLTAHRAATAIRHLLCHFGSIADHTPHPPSLPHLSLSSYYSFASCYIKRSVRSRLIVVVVVLSVHFSSFRKKGRHLRGGTERHERKMKMYIKWLKACLFTLSTTG